MSNSIAAEIRTAIAASGNPERAAAQQAYMKSDLPFCGHTSPELKAILRPHLAAWKPADRKEWEAAVRDLWDNVTFREEWYAGLALLRHRGATQWLDRDAVPLLQHVITQGAWWDVVDEIAAHPLGTALVQDRPALTATLEHWAIHPDLWLRRSAVIAQLRRGPDTDLDLLTFAIEANLEDTSFWLRKAIGWALRQHAKTDPGWVRAQVEHWGDRLSGLSRREALKHL